MLPPPQNGSKALKEIVLKVCAFKHEDRFQNVRVMLDTLEGKTVVTDTSTITGKKTDEDALNITEEEQKRRIAEQNAAARAAVEQAQRDAAEQARRAAEAEKIRQQTDPAQKTAEAPKENKQQESYDPSEERREDRIEIIKLVIGAAVMVLLIAMMVYYRYWTDNGCYAIDGMLGILFEWIRVHGEKVEKIFMCGVMFIGVPWALYDTFIKPSSKKE